MVVSWCDHQSGNPYDMYVQFSCELTLQRSAYAHIITNVSAAKCGV